MGSIINWTISLHFDYTRWPLTFVADVLHLFLAHTVDHTSEITSFIYWNSRADVNLRFYRTVSSSFPTTTSVRRFNKSEGKREACRATALLNSHKYSLCLLGEFSSFKHPKLSLKNSGVRHQSPSQLRQHQLELKEPHRQNHNVLLLQSRQSQMDRGKGES